MKIAFIGQLGLPELQHDSPNNREPRVLNLAKELSDEGHIVTIFGTDPYIVRGNYRGIELVRIPSLDPSRPGGWWYVMASLWSAWRRSPDVLHLHGWRVAVLAGLARLLMPAAVLVWTVDSWPQLPQGLTRFILRHAAARVDAIVTPHRQLQYRLLVEFNISAQYVPDGYSPTSLPALPLAQLGLRAGGYVLALAESPAELRQVAKAVKAARAGRRLVIAQNNVGVFKRLAKQYRFIRLVGKLEGRALHSVIKEAVVVVLADESVSSNSLLQSMDQQKAVVAITEPRYQELSGESARYYRVSDLPALSEALQAVLADEKLRLSLGRAARKRARRHFTWERIAREYATQYAPDVRLVPIDSARPEGLTTDVQTV